jgi:hypothetical protein
MEGKEEAMKRQATLQPHQLERFVKFLEEHPGFSPTLIGEDALVCGFQVGGSFLAIDELEKMIATEPHFDEQEAALLLSPLGHPARGLPSGTEK